MIGHQAIRQGLLALVEANSLLLELALHGHAQLLELRPLAGQPGFFIGQPAAEWRRSLALLRGAASAPSVGVGRPATVDDVQSLGRYIPALAGMPQRDRDALITTGRVIEAESGSVVTRAGEKGDSAYFVLEGRLVAGRTSGEGAYQSLSAMGPGDVFGEIAALTGSESSASHHIGKYFSVS